MILDLLLVLVRIPLNEPLKAMRAFVVLLTLYPSEMDLITLLIFYVYVGCQVGPETRIIPLAICP
jgi:hypothetical protein